MSYIVNRTSGKFEILEFDQMDRIIGSRTVFTMEPLFQCCHNNSPLLKVCIFC